MPKPKEKSHQKARRITAEFSSDGIESHGNNFISQNCGKLIGDISNMRKCQIEQHVKSARHVQNAELKSKDTSSIAKNLKPYTTDLCRECFIFLLNDLKILRDNFQIFWWYFGFNFCEYTVSQTE
ncbi:hypothetical protein PGB90_004000 [Kerria lacca]